VSPRLWYARGMNTWIIVASVGLLAGAWAGTVGVEGQPGKQQAPAGKEPESKEPAVTHRRDAAAAEKLGFVLGTQAWTFRDRTAFEAIETAARLGLGAIELFPGQTLKPGSSSKVGPDLSASERAELREKLGASKVEAMALGVWNFSKDEAAGRKIFEFAKEMGIGVVTCEPAVEAWDVVGKLASEFKIKAACHNHPKPSTYWNPDKVLESLKGRGEWVGACADTGHWVRSGVSTLEALKKYDGKIVSLHFKDVKDGVDQPWGTGAGEAAKMLRELRRQKFKGLVSVEYETGSGVELEKVVVKCIEFFDRECAAIVAEESEKAR